MIQKKSRPGKVVVELKEVEVDAGAVHPDDADPHECIGQLLYFRICTGNLPVKGLTVLSRHSAEDDHQRTPGFLRIGEPGCEIRMPPRDRKDRFVLRSGKPCQKDRENHRAPLH